MKKHFYFILLLPSVMFAQAPIINGDTMLCPDSSGTAVVSGTQAYDSYTWYTKYWFTSDPFEVVDGQNGPSFTYDWYKYDQSLIKVVVTLNGETFESNTIQIDSYAWVGMFVANEEGENVQYDPNSNSWSLCEGTTFDLEIFNPYIANIQWYKDGVAIPDANQMIYTVAEAGTYYVIAAPPFCPEITSTSFEFNVTINAECNLGISYSDQKAFVIYPNPARDLITITGTESIDRVELFTMTGQRVIATDSNTLDISALPKGIYVIAIRSGVKFSKQKLVRE